MERIISTYKIVLKLTNRSRLFSTTGRSYGNPFNSRVNSGGIAPLEKVRDDIVDPEAYSRKRSVRKRKVVAFSHW